MTSGIYSITNKINGKRYIGSAIDFKYRWTKHKCELNHNKHHSSHLQRAWLKYGEENFIFEIICYVGNKEKLLKIEQTFLDLYKSYDEKFGYNACSVAGSPFGVKRSKETKEKISKANKGRPISAEMKDYLSNSRIGEGNPFFGKTHSEESKMKISDAQKGEKNHQFGKKITPETKEKISKSLKGKPAWNKGKKYSNKKT